MRPDNKVVVKGEWETPKQRLDAAEKVLGEGTIENVAFSREDGLRFEVTLHTRPEFDLGDYKEVGDPPLLAAIADGTFGLMKRPADKGKGLDGVARKARDYYNPATEILEGAGR